MKQVIRLTESDLHRIVKESVRKLIREYGDTKETRKKMAAAAKRGIRRGDSTPHENAMHSLLKRGSSKEELADYQKDLEED